MKLYTLPPPNPSHSKNSPPTHDHGLIFNLQISLEKSVSTVGRTLKKKKSSKSFSEGKKYIPLLEAFSRDILMKYKLKLNDLMSCQRKGL